MSRFCRCSRGCRHLVPRIGSGHVAPIERLEALLPALDALIDAAADFDEDGLAISPDCEVHGERPVTNSECTCRGQRYSAVEFVQTLILDIHVRGQRSTLSSESLGAAARRRHSESRMVSVA